MMKPELLNSFKQYHYKDFFSDIMAGLLVAIIALPLSIALGLDSGATIQQGIMTAIVAGFFISVLGGSKFQIGGPTAAFAVILVGYINNPDIGFLGLQIATICAGILLVIMGFSRVGKLIKYIPFPIIIGFTTGIGITLMTGQLKSFLGVTVAAGNSFVCASGFISKLATLFMNITSINWMTVLIGVVTLTVIILLPKINKKIPAAFIAIIVATVLNVIIEKASGRSFGVATIGSTYGDIKAEFDVISFVGIESIKYAKLIVPTLVIAFLCAIESLLSATVADGMTDTKHNSNQELVGQGVANIMSSLFCGLPATGAIARTAANINNNAKSPLAGMFHAIFLLIMYVSLMPIVKYIPLASLAAVLIMVAFGMSNFPLFAKLATFAKRDTAILMVSCILTVFLDLTYGVLGGIVLSIILMLPNLIHPAKLVEVEASEVFGSQKFNYEKIKYYAVNYDITFNSINGIIAKIENAAKENDVIVVDCSKIKRIDSTSVEKLAKCAKAFSKRNKRLVLHNANNVIKTRYVKSFMHIIKKW